MWQIKYKHKKLCNGVFFIGIYTSIGTTEDETCFLTERNCLHDLVRGLETACPCGKSSSPWAISSVVQVNFCIRYSYILTSDKAVCHTRHSFLQFYFVMLCSGFCLFLIFLKVPIFNVEIVIARVTAFFLFDTLYTSIAM